MNVADVAILFVLVGLVLYVVLAGADFGAALWQATAGRGERAEKVREHAHDSMAPVWEANHVWLIFVLTVLWTAYPSALGSLASTLAVALTVAALGIIGRGAAYALRAGTSVPRELNAIDVASAASSVLAPFALGAAVGGIASGRVPPGNAAGDLWSSWLNPTSIAIGIIAVAVSAYTAAVFLAADALRVRDPELERAFRLRALIAGGVAGALAAGGLVVLHQDAHRLYDRLLAGPGLPAVLLSIVAGAATLALIVRRRHEAARYTAALAVAAVVGGWALAQQPELLPGLSVREAAAPPSSQVAVIVAVLGGGAILFPSLALLFRLALSGRLRHADDEPRAPAA
ncbi:MAG: cytochrome d ubiquinol oxidase subunit II, partial [Actinomycetota bacterium]|nr:cytochrome d ubiquinol oxidase subunit II [Actinomycetota bacterium]